jgi:cytochrome oxidase assembly protein ShyY1
VRFLLSRRWALFALAVVVLGVGCYFLGRWQFHRLHERETTNAQVRHNLAAEPAPLTDVMSTDRPVRSSDEWRRVDVSGTYVTDKSVVIRYQTREGQSGVDVVTPLRTSDGPSVLVDRGWLKTDNVGSDHVDAPAAPSGEVSVVGYVRVDATGDSTAVTNGSARTISSRAIEKSTGLPLYRGFLDAEKETPAPAKPLVKAELPDLGNGPHFFYGLQWWFFGLLAVGGFCYFVWDERRRSRASTGQSQGAQHPTVDREHRAGDEARSG